VHKNVQIQPYSLRVTHVWRYNWQ